MSGKRKFVQKRDEQDHDFVVRVLKGVFDVKSRDDLVLHHIEELLYARTGSREYSGFLVQVLMVFCGNAIGEYSEKKDRMNAPEIAADFVTAVFSNKYLANLEKELGWRDNAS